MNKPPQTAKRRFAKVNTPEDISTPIYTSDGQAYPEAAQDSPEGLVLPPLDVTHEDVLMGEKSVSPGVVLSHSILEIRSIELACRERQLLDALRRATELQGAMKAQDEREQLAGQRIGILWEESGCDWPDTVADRVEHLRSELAENVRRATEAEKKSHEWFEKYSTTLNWGCFEHAIVARIWAMFGSPSYEELKGRSIYDLIEELRSRATEAEGQRDEFERKGQELCCVLGNLLIHLHELGLRYEDQEKFRYRNERAESAEAEVAELQKQLDAANGTTEGH